MTPITVNVSRRDLVTLNVLWLASPRRTWPSFLVVFLIVVALIAFTRGWPDTSRAWVALAVGGLGGAVGGILAGFLFGLLWVVFASSKAPGVLGIHHYVFTDGGLLETTDANETLVKWGGARSVARTGEFLHIEVAPGMFHVLPRKSFSSDAEYQAFCERAVLLASTKA